MTTLALAVLDEIEAAPPPQVALTRDVQDPGFGDRFRGLTTIGVPPDDIISRIADRYGLGSGDARRIFEAAGLVEPPPPPPRRGRPPGARTRRVASADLFGAVTTTEAPATEAAEAPATEAAETPATDTTTEAPAADASAETTTEATTETVTEAVEDAPRWRRRR